MTVIDLAQRREHRELGRYVELCRDKGRTVAIQYERGMIDQTQAMARIDLAITELLNIRGELVRNQFDADEGQAS